MEILDIVNDKIYLLERQLLNTYSVLGTALGARI